MSKVKGTGWISIREYYVETIGEEGIKKVIAELAPADQEIFAKPILPSQWIDYAGYFRFLLKADQIYSHGDYQMLTAANVFAAQRDFNGLYKFLISFLGPQTIIKNSPLLWSQFYNRGVASYEKIANNKYNYKITDFPDIPLNHDREQTPYLLECLKMSRCKNPRAEHVKCIARGDEFCLWGFSWD